MVNFEAKQVFKIGLDDEPLEPNSQVDLLKQLG